MIKYLYDSGSGNTVFINKSEIPNPKSEIELVLRARLELARLTALAPKTSAATNYAISADFICKKQANLNLSFLEGKV